MFRQAIRRFHGVGRTTRGTTRLVQVPLRRQGWPITKAPGMIGGRFYSINTEGEDISDSIDKISIGEYHRVADEYLETLADELETLAEDNPQVDAELSHGVLTLVLPPYGTYVINKQPPNQQIWLSSPVSGPKRFDLIKSRWITLRDNSSLTETLETELSSALGNETKLDVQQ